MTYCAGLCSVWYVGDVCSHDQCVGPRDEAEHYHEVLVRFVGNAEVCRICPPQESAISISGH
jgi:hypothetical protein